MSSQRASFALESLIFLPVSLYSDNNRGHDYPDQGKRPSEKADDASKAIQRDQTIQSLPSFSQ
ncbi:MAG TPA: hypothetical protein VKR06_16275 [Ktedonosporobacter sp.]|nr:hypothetical protein [Ktedonosporobacter sp.]